MTEDTPGPEKAAPAGSTRVRDVLLIIAMVLVFGWLAGGAAFLGFGVGFAQSECEPRCVSGALEIGTGIAVIGPVVVAIVVIGLTLWRLARRLRTWWLPPVGLLALPIPFIIGNLIVGMGG